FDGYEVVWWDPSALKLGAQPRFGVRQEQLLGKEASRPLVDDNLRRFLEWQDERAAAICAGARAQHAVQTATVPAAAGDEPPPPVELIELPRAPGRPAGARFGALVHAVLATAPLDGSDADLQRAATVQARLLGAADDELAAAIAAVRAALRHPLLQRA